MLSRIVSRSVSRYPVQVLTSVRHTSNNSHSRAEHKYSRKWGLLALLVGGSAFGVSQFLDDDLPPKILPVANAATKAKVGRREQFNFIADVVEISGPSVVLITIQDTQRIDHFTGTPLTASNGSGFIVDEDGLILTNAHVVINKPYSRVQVKLNDGRVFPGYVEEVDTVSDLATVRIHCKNLTPIKLGESSTLRSGEWVVALGSPLSLNNTVTAGVVSSTQRDSKELGMGTNIKYIQTDAAITFGNSGGPLVNLDGEAIGINSMKITPGISFAIPIDYAKQFLDHAKERSRMRGSAPQTTPVRRYMGITMITLTNEIIQELRQRSHPIPSSLNGGVLVWKVIVGSPAHTGGLSPGDIVTSINGKSVKTSEDIYNALTRPGESIEMIVFRGQDKFKIVVHPEDPE